MIRDDKIHFALKEEFIGANESTGDQAGRHGARDGLQGLEPEFLRRDTKLNQLGFVDSDGIIVGLGGVVDTIFKVLDRLVLLLNRLLDLVLDLLYRIWREGGILHELMELGLLLLKLFNLRIHLPHQDHIMHFSVFLDLFGEGLKFVIKFLLVHHNPVVFLAQLCELFLHLDYFLFEGRVLAFVVLQTHLVFFELPQQRFQSVFFHAGVVEWLLHLIVLDLQFGNLLLVLLRFLVDLLYFGLVLLDQLQVVPRDLIVVVLELCEGLVVVFDELVDMQVLPFLQLMDVHFEFEVELFLHGCQLLLVVLLCGCQDDFVFLQDNLLVVFVLFIQLLGFFVVFLFVLDLLMFEVMLDFLHVLHAVVEVLVLLGVGRFAILFDPVVRFLLLVLQQLESLQEHLHLLVMAHCHVLCFGLLVQDVGLGLFYLEFGVVVELLDHISIHLDVISFGLEVTDLVLHELEVGIELGGGHLDELVIGLLLLLGLLWTHGVLMNISYNIASAGGLEYL